MKIKFKDGTFPHLSESVLAEDRNNYANDIIINEKNHKLSVNIGNRTPSQFCCRIMLEATAGYTIPCTLFWDQKAKSAAQLFIRIDEGPMAGQFRVFSLNEARRNLTSTLKGNIWLDSLDRFETSQYELKAAANEIERKQFPDQLTFFDRTFESNPFIKEFRMPEYFQLVLKNVYHPHPEKKQQGMRAYGSLLQALKKIDDKLKMCIGESSALITQIEKAEKNPNYSPDFKINLQNDLKHKHKIYMEQMNELNKLSKYINVAKETVKQSQRVIDDLNKKMAVISNKIEQMEKLMQHAFPNHYAPAQRKKFRTETDTLEQGQLHHRDKLKS